jgi:hypothetical protein
LALNRANNAPWEKLWNRAPQRELHDLIVWEMGLPEGVYVTVDPDPSTGWHVSVSASGEPSRTARYNLMAQEIAARLRQKYSLKTQ